MQEKEVEINDLWDTAKYREIASGAFYTAGQTQTDDPGARALMKRLAAEEAKHLRWLTEYQKHREISHYPEKINDLAASEYFTGADSLEGAGLQETLVFAIKREQQAVDFYTRMTAIMTTAAGKALCEQLASQELRHKIKLELLYERLFLKED
jgi:rubrerythrin